MAVIASRITSTGNLHTTGNAITGILDEVGYTGTTPPYRITNTGNLQIAGILDEVTGPVVTNGLVAYIDAGKTASYAGTGNIAIDLTTNNAATLNGSITWVNAGQASYWNFATGASTAYISSVLSQNYLDATLVFYPDFSYVSGASLAYGLGAGTAADKTMRFSGANGTGPWTVVNPDNTDGWASSATTYYINGTAYTGAGNLASGWNIVGGTRTNTTNGAFAAPFSYTWGTGFTGRYYQGRLAAILLYNRSLTAAEQQQNYNYFASRYGLATTTTLASRQITPAGNVKITGQFDEVSGMVATGSLLYLNAATGYATDNSGFGKWQDLSTYGGNVTLNNSPTYSSTTGGGSFNFNGSTQSGTITPSQLNVTYTGKTVFAVVRISASAFTSGVAQYRAIVGSTATRNWNFYVYHDASNLYYLHFSPGTTGLLSSATSAITLNTWLTLAVSQAANGDMSWYANGQLINVSTGSSLSQYTTSNETVGAADNYWMGDIAACMLYPRPLTSAEILNNHNAFAPRVGIATVGI